MANAPSENLRLARPIAWLALALAAGAVGGSLWLSLRMGLKACPLCLYQRSFVMAALAVLTVGLVLRAVDAATACVLALPAAVAGTSVAAFHVYLESIGKLECPPGVFDLGTAPKQSLSVLALLTALLLLGSLTGKSFLVKMLHTLVAVVIGVALAVGAVASAPPPPPSPTSRKDQPRDICWPPYRGSPDENGPAP
jgi:disulfide bond formation protein DsbB